MYYINLIQDILYNYIIMSPLYIIISIYGWLYH